MRHRLDRRELEQLELDQDDEQPRRRVPPDPAAWGRSASPDAQLLAYRSSPDLGLLAKAAQQDVQISNYQEEVASLQSQRRWLIGGLGVSVAAFLLIVIRRRPRPANGLATAPQRGQRA